jgi:TPR repeat protein
LETCSENYKNSPPTTITWYLKLAKQDHVVAQYNLGVCYRNGIGTRENFCEAFFWFLKAAHQGYARAQYNVGLYYENGMGIEKEEAQALHWYAKAAAQGYPQAQYSLELANQKHEHTKNEAT